MALKLTVKSPNGEVIKDAIHRVEDACIYSNKAVRFLLRSYENVDSTDSFECHTMSVEYDENNGSLENQAYLYVKSLSNFFGAEDC